jgi:hypothetical protein
MIDNKEFIDRCIGALSTYDSKEKKTSIMEDFNLIGYIDLISEMISQDSTLLTKEECLALVQ